jgi:hypothetical protein
MRESVSLPGLLVGLGLFRIFDVVGEPFWDADKRGYTLMFKVFLSVFICVNPRPILISPTKSIFSGRTICDCTEIPINV